MITLYHAPQSRSSRIIWLLEELGAPYRIEPVSIFRPMSGLGIPDPANPHPDKQVPAIVDGDELVAESIAIVLYLTDAFHAAGLGRGVGEAGRGAYLTWVSWYAAAMEPAMFAAMGNELGTAPLKQRGYDKMVGRIEYALARHPHMMGEAFSAVDLLVASAINFARGAFPASQALDDYVARCTTRPAAIRAAALDHANGLQRAA